jgi:hypothetical protein
MFVRFASYRDAYVRLKAKRKKLTASLADVDAILEILEES